MTEETKTGVKVTVAFLQKSVFVVSCGVSLPEFVLTTICFYLIRICSRDGRKCQEVTETVASIHLLMNPRGWQEFITRYGSRLGPGLKTVERIVEYLSTLTRHYFPFLYESVRAHTPGVCKSSRQEGPSRKTHVGLLPRCHRSSL